MADGAQKSAAKAPAATATRRAAVRSGPGGAELAGMQAIGSLHAWGGNDAVHRMLGQGTPLSESTRIEFERRFDADFSGVRVHDDDAAHASAEALNANAYTIGADIVFGSGRFAPGSGVGRTLIAHELAHVVQQRRGGAAPALDAQAPHEHAADAAARAYASADASINVGGGTGLGVARDEKETPSGRDFYLDAFHGNRAWYWGSFGKTIADWPVDPQLKALWDKLPVSKEKGKEGPVSAKAVSSQPEFVEFANRVREFQHAQMAPVHPTWEGVVNPATAQKFREREAARKPRGTINRVSAPAAKPLVAFAASGSAGKKASKSTNAAESLAERALGFALNPEKEVTTLVRSAVSEFGADKLKALLVDLLIRSLGLPSTGARLATAVGKGMGEQLAQELVIEGKGAKLLEHLKTVTPGDVDELKKGYYVGLVEGLVSPVTDLFGIIVFGEKMQNMMADLAISAFNNRGNVQKELDELAEELTNVTKKLGEFWRKVREKPADALMALLSAPEAMAELAEQKAYELGKAGGSAIVAGLESPWKPQDPAAHQAPDPVKSPAAYVEHLAKAGEDYILDTPWSKVGSKVGYAIGFVAIQAILIAFTSGIGNAIAEVGSALGKVGRAISALSKGLGAAVERVAQVVKWLGEGVTLIETGVMKVIEKGIEKLPFLETLLRPVSALFTKLRNFLRKLFGVAEKEGVALVESATAKTAAAVDEAPLLAPKPPPPKPPVKPDVAPKTRPTAGSQPKVDLEPKTAPEPKGKFEPDPQTVPQPKPKVEPEPKAKLEPDPKPRVEPDPKPKVEPDPKPKVEPEPKPKVEPQQKPKAKAKTATPSESAGTEPGPTSTTQPKPKGKAPSRRKGKPPSDAAPKQGKAPRKPKPKKPAEKPTDAQPPKKTRPKNSGGPGPKKPKAPKQPPAPPKSLDEQILDAERELNEARKRVVEYKKGRVAEGEKPKGGPYKDLWNKQERLWVLKRARAYPSRQLLEQAQIVGVKGPDGTIKAANTIAKEGRTLDFVEVDGKKVLGGDLKSKDELIGSIEGGVKKPTTIEGKFREKSKVGWQHAKEDLILEEARKSGGKLVIRGHDVRTGKQVTMEVDLTDYSSTVITYGEIYPN